MNRGEKGILPELLLVMADVVHAEVAVNVDDAEEDDDVDEDDDEEQVLLDDDA